MARDLTGKVIVITGASSGIGAATAVEAARAGMDVVLGARRETRLAEVADQVRQLGRAGETVTCDVTDPAQNDTLVERAWQRFGRVDAVFANAGYGMFGSVLETPMDEHRRIFEVNYFATLLTLKAAEPYIRKTPDGLKHMLICSSAASELGIPMFGAYAATKAAQDCIAGAMRGELADEGIAVTSVHPVGTRTEFFDTAKARSPRTGAGEPAAPNTPVMFSQTAQQVARKIVATLRRPKPELWPMASARWAMALGTVLPGLAARLMRKHYHRVKPGA